MSRIRIVIFLLAALTPLLGATKPTAAISYDKQIQPLLLQYCYGCHNDAKHKADLSLEKYRDLAGMIQDRPVWEKVLHHISTREMPPENKPQPSIEQRDLISKWIETQIFNCDCEHPDPGRVTLRRLNRTEYNNTIRDLIGIDYQPADSFPVDDVGYGFDNIGDVLSMPPILVEKYLAAAEKILNIAIVSEPVFTGPTAHFEAESMATTGRGTNFQGYAWIFKREGEIYTNFQASAEGDYLLRVRAFGQQAGAQPAKLEFRIDDEAREIVSIPAVEVHPRMYEARLHITAGDHKLAMAFVNNYVDTREGGEGRDRNLIVDFMEAIGPLHPAPVPESHTRIFFKSPKPGSETATARELLDRFASRAFRRPAKPEEIDHLMTLFRTAHRQGQSFEESMKLPLQAVLVSPHFLFHEELQPDPNDPKAIKPLSEFALASRLSYFLWSSMPDEALFKAAAQGKLRKNLESEVIRMLRDSRSTSLVENFGEQWLQIRNLRSVTPGKSEFPEFDEDLRDAMEKETEMFLDYVVKADRSILEFIDADYTFLNEKLAKHYGIEGVVGDQFRQVSVKGTERGGLLTEASILTVTSNPTRTSPVKRGKWVLDNLLGAPPPPPPPDVPALQESKDAVLSGPLRHRMEQHRENPLCASCHARMDPIGFGFENFDGVGAWRSKDGAFPIDPAGTITSGENFQGPAELKKILLKSKREDFVRCLSTKMLTYALGRGLEFYDKCAVDKISADMAKRKYKFSGLVMEIVTSVPFQSRRGELDREPETPATP